MIVAFSKARNKRCRFALLSSALLLCLAIAVRVDFTNAESTSACEESCPVGYVLLEDTCACYPHEQQVHSICPDGSIFQNGKCRKIVCPHGEFYRGTCLQAMCPPGLVWRSKKCQEPGYLTTVLEIENVLINEVHEKPIYLEKIGNNQVVHHTTTSNPNTRNQAPPTTMKPVNQLPTLRSNPSVPGTTNHTGGCCKVRTPRICKRYGQKWICFNRSQSLCDERVCSAPIVYLKPPEIKYVHPILIMPPNPTPPSPSQGNGAADCSGCASNHPENCSPYCSLYMCPSGACNFMNLDLYCAYYPGQFGCLKEDGCLWNWC